MIQRKWKTQYCSKSSLLHKTLKANNMKKSEKWTNKMNNSNSTDMNLRLGFILNNSHVILNVPTESMFLFFKLNLKALHKIISLKWLWLHKLS